MVNTLRRIRQTLARWIGGIPVNDESGVTLLGRQLTAAGVDINEITAFNIAAVFCAIAVRMDMFSMLPVGVYKKRADGGRDPVPTNAADSIISLRPNPEMTARRFWALMEHDKIAWGRAIAEIQWDMAGRPKYLWRIEPWRCKPARDEDGRVIVIVDGKRVIYDNDLIRMPGFSGDGLDGQSILSHYGRESLGLTAATEQYGASFFGEGGVPTGILEHPGSMSKPARDEMRRDWKETHSPTSGGASHQIAILWNGMKYNQISIPPEDAQFLSTRQFQIEEVSRWFKVPPHMLYHLMHAHFKNIEEQGIDFVRRSLMPEIVDWEQEVNYKLLTPPKIYCKWNTHGLLRGDMAAQTQHFKEMFGIGVYSGDDIREMLDQNPIPGGDQRFIPLNMIPLDKAAEYFEKSIENKSQPIPGDQTPTNPREENDEDDDDDDQPPQDPEEDNNDLQVTRSQLIIAAETMFRDSLARMARKETKAARRAAQQHNKFFAWMDEFYPTFEEQLTEAIDAPLKAWRLASGRSEGLADIGANLLAKRYVRSSRDAFLRASECQPDEFSLRINAVCAHIESQQHGITPDGKDL